MSCLEVLLLPDEKYKDANLKMRLITDMIAYKTEEKFHITCSNIISDRCNARYKAGEKWDENEVLSIKEHNEEFEAYFRCYLALERVFESEFGSIEPWKKIMETVADGYVNIMLKGFGWIKEEKANA